MTLEDTINKLDEILKKHAEDVADIVTLSEKSNKPLYHPDSYNVRQFNKRGYEYMVEVHNMQFDDICSTYKVKPKLLNDLIRKYQLK